MNKSIRDKIAVGLGSSLDWYDFALYGFFASHLTKLFFPIYIDQNKNLALTFATWFMGFAARPLGAIIFGYIGDKYGRKICFKITAFLILIPVLSFPLLPTYNQIGYYAPLILLCLRIIQGICIGGEFAGSIIYLCETAPKSQNYFFGSLGSCTGSFGILLASLVSSIIHLTLNETEVNLYGWRIAFGLAIILSFISLKMRQSIRETPVFLDLQNINHISFLTKLKDNWKQILLGCGIIFLHASSFYMIFVFLPTFINRYLNISSGASFVSNTALLACRILIIPIIGMLADKIGGKIILLVSSILFFILSYPLFYLITNFKGEPIFYGAIALFALLTTLNAGTVPGLLIKMFPADTRYFSLSFSFNISFGIFGGIVPSVSIFLIELLESKTVLGLYLMFAAMVTFISLYCFYGEKNDQML